MEELLELRELVVSGNLEAALSLIDELEEILAEAYNRALDNASLDAFDGIYDELTLKNMVDQELIIKQALNFIFN